MLRALLLHREDSGVRVSIEDVSEDRLPEGDVFIGVGWSSLNYKDGLAITDRSPIVRGEFPFVPGIDLGGVVIEDDSDTFKEGTEVVLTGWGTGEDRWGGFATKARAQAGHLVALPEGMTLEQSMIIGTAGFTAMLGVMALEEHCISPDKGEVVVTGASGGVGSMAVVLLAELGYDVVASTGPSASHEYLRSLGASRVIPREQLGEGPRRPLDRGFWAGAIDAVGGPTLAAVISQLKTHGSVAAAGLAQSHKLDTTVFPFILRGANLLGIDSNTCPTERRVQAWDRLAEILQERHYQLLHTATINLEQLPEYSARIIEGKTQGRILVAP